MQFPRLSIRGTSSRTKIIAGTALLSACVIAAFAVMAWFNYQNAVASQGMSLRNLSYAFSAQTQGTMQLVERLMSEAEVLYAEEPEPDRYAVVRKGDSAHFKGPLNDNLLDISILDHNGRLLLVYATAKGQGEPDPTLTGFRAEVARGIDMTIETAGRPGRNAILKFGRPFADATGTAIGTIVVRIDAGELQQLYETIDLGEGGSVTLLRLDGQMLMRGPTLPGWIGKDMGDTPLFREQLPRAEHGFFQSVSPVDGVVRLYGYDVVDGYPLVVTVGLDKVGALALWVKWVRVTAVLVLVLVVFLGLLGWMLLADAARKAELIEALRLAKESLEKSTVHLENVLNTIDNPVIVTDLELNPVLSNQAFRKLWPNDRMSPMGGLRPTGDATAADTFWRRGLQYSDRTSGPSVSSDPAEPAEYELVDGHGTLRTVLASSSVLSDMQNTRQIVHVLTDISQRKAAEVRLAHLAQYDELTGLPNFFHFRSELNRVLLQGAPRQAGLHLLLVSLGRLGEIGKLCGREAGDGVMKSAGTRLRACLQPPCFIGRTKYDEFGIFFADAEPELARKRAADVFALLSAPVAVDGTEFYLGPIIGGAHCPSDTQAGDELLRFADTAMHQAATEGQGLIKFFKSDNHGQLADDLALEGLLHRAIQKGELRLVYQPKVDVATAAITGFEALLRWNTPALGEVSPVRFIPIAEKTDLIIRIGAWVLDAACRQAAQWERDFGRPVRVAVNLSLQQFHQEDLVEMIRNCMAAAQLPPASLELEITESTVMSRDSDLDGLMQKIHALGVKLSIDDFGTGYSSLAHVKRFPAQVLKIDRSFITDLAADASSLAIVQSIIALAHGLHLKVVAEGVETEAQLAILRGLACDEFQGYLFSRPLETAAAEALMRNAWQAA